MPAGKDAAVAETISILLPSRGRPESLDRCVESLARTASRPELVQVVLRFDDDDESRRDPTTAGKLRVTSLVGPRRTMGVLLDDCLAHSEGEIVFLFNDDAVAKSAGWDEAIRSAAGAFPDGVYLVYANDLFKRDRTPVFPVISRRTLGAMAQRPWRAYLGSFIDVHFMDVFQRLRQLGHDRIRFLPDVVFEHLHHRLGKSSFDATYADRDRFGDDDKYLQLRGFRQTNAVCLAALVTGDPPPTDTTVEDRPQPGSVAAILLDRDVPFAYRLRQSVWFACRRAYTMATGFFSRRSRLGKSTDPAI